jgi:hypothetical protein
LRLDEKAGKQVLADLPMARTYSGSQVEFSCGDAS